MTTADLPRLAGVAEAADVLGIARSHVVRRRREDKMPWLVADLDSTPVWLLEDVEALAAGTAADALPERATLPILGLGEAARLLKIDKSQIGRWRRGGRFVAPDDQLRAGPIWLDSTLLEWRAANPPRPKPKPKPRKPKAKPDQAAAA